jgi:hypothetical protein
VRCDWFPEAQSFVVNSTSFPQRKPKLARRYSLEIRHTRAHVPPFRSSLEPVVPAVILRSGTENLLTYKSLDASGGSVFLNLIRPAMLD